MSTHEAPGNRASDPKPTEVPFDSLRTLHEKIEETWHELRRDADSRVFDDDLDLFFSTTCPNADRATLVGVLRRVVKQVAEHLCHALGIDVDEKAARWNVDH